MKLMSKTSRRLLMSFLLSLACAAGTHYWYINGSSISSNYGNQQPIARLTEYSNEVHRRPLKRLIWQNLSQNDSLFGGEQIRTQGNSTAVIEVLDGGAIIELEPGSLITLEKNDGKLSLDFLQGNLFVKGGGDGSDLSLKSGGKEISLGKAEVSLGKGADGKMDVQVLKGTVDGATSAADPFQIVAPAPLAEVFAYPDLRKSVAWEWLIDLDPQFQLSIETGKTRIELKALAGVEVKGKKAIGTLPPGDHFWKVVAINPNNPSEKLESKIYKIKVLPIRPPIAIYPEKNAQLALLDTKPEIPIRWVNPGKLENLVLEFAESKDFKKGYQSIPVREKEEYLIPQLKKGSYFWRVTGYLPKTKEAVLSEVMNFSASVEKAFTGPELLQPEDKSKFLGDEKRPLPIRLSWKPVPGAIQYRVVVKELESKKEREYVAASTDFTIDKAEAGNFEWQVYAIDSKQLKSPLSLTWSYQVSRLPRIVWKDPAERSEHFYFTATPELNVEWQAAPVTTAKYRLLYKKALLDKVEAEKSEKAILAEGTQGRVPLPDDGEWTVQVESLSGDGTVIARSAEKTLDVQVAPLLAAPTFSPVLPNPIKADRKGAMTLQWLKVPDAVAYQVELLNPAGVPVKTQKVEGSQISYEKLKPGKMKVKVQAIDKAERRGIASETREVIVPDSSDVRAPKMMKIEVK